jgi:hypothetical protein
MAQPANDNCAQAAGGFTMAGGTTTLTGTLAGATRDSQPTSCPYNQTGFDVYHLITPALGGVYTFETCGLTAWDTALSLHTACPTGAANQVAGGCNDDGCGTQSRMTVLLQAGQAYILRVGSYSSATTNIGTYSVLVTYMPQAPNDECGSGVGGSGNPVLVPDVPVTFSNAGATTSISITPSNLCGNYPGSGGGADLFFTITPPVPGLYTFDTCGSAIDTVMSLHSGCPATEANLIVCNDDGGCPGNTLTSQVSALLAAGEAYFVRVAGYGTPDTPPRTGSITLTAHRNVTTVVTGACCGAAGDCQFGPAPGCAGTFLGDGIVCSPTPCPPPIDGACCLFDGTCISGGRTACNGGVYQGDGSTCGTMVCPPTSGVCCVGAICELRLPQDCLGSGLAGAVYVGGVACVGSSASQPCCRADFNKVDGVTVQDIFDFLNAWFAGSPFTQIAAPGTSGVQDIFDFLNTWFAGCF